MNIRLAETVWTDVPRRQLVLIPVGSTEQHGPHLPLDTDTTIAGAVAEAAAARLGPETVIAPAVPYGSSGEHQSFAGTSSIGTETLQLVVTELARSLSTWAGRMVFVNAHGGNSAALSKAVFQLIAEQHDVGWVPCATEDVDLHAGITETSLMLHLRPSSVLAERAEPGNTRPLADIFPALATGGIGAVSPNGVLGDPRGATAEHGARLMDQMTDDVVSRVRRWSPDRHGVLLAPDRQLVE